MSTIHTSEATAKKDIQRLQRAIVDGLEDVKAQDIVVFNTEKLSPLFERVIVASGTSNRQTKALASSVRDAVRDAGFPKPRSEGEDNGEWIIVDCAQAVVHIMQPAIRQYYRLEEIWGETPVRLKFGASKPVAPAKPAAKSASKGAAGKKTKAKQPIAGVNAAQAATKKIAPKKTAGTAKPAVKTASKPAAKKAAAKKPVAKKPSAPKTAAARSKPKASKSSAKKGA
jgi:ribosome-associated protein